MKGRLHQGCREPQGFQAQRGREEVYTEGPKGLRGGLVAEHEKPDHPAMILVSSSVGGQSDYGRNSVEAKLEGAQLGRLSWEKVIEVPGGAGGRDFNMCAHPKTLLLLRSTSAQRLWGTPGLSFLNCQG